MNRLNLTVDHSDGETHMSFASRLAARNGRHSLYAFTKDFDVDIDTLLTARGGTLEWLAEAGGVSLDSLSKHAIRHDGKDKLIGHERVHMNKIVTTAGKLCPLCASEQIKGKDQSQFCYSLPDNVDHWLPWIETCLVHEIALVSLEIPEDAKKYTRYAGERSMIVDANEAVIREAIKDPKPLKANNYERYLADRLRGIAPAYEVLAPLSLSAIVDVIAVMGKAGIEARRKDDIEDFSSREISDVGFRLLTGSYQEVKAKVLEVWSDENSLYPYNRFGSFGRWLRLKQTSSLFDPIKSTFSRLINETSAAGPGDEIFGIPIESRNWHSIQSVTEASKVNNWTVWRICRNRGWVTGEKPTKPKSEYLLPIGDGDALIAELSEYRTEFDVATCLGAWSDLGRSLVDAGILKHIAGTGMQGVDAMISKEVADNFVKTLRSKLRFEPNSPKTPIHTAYVRTHTRLADLIAAIIEDRLTADITAESLQVDHICLDLDEIRTAKRDPGFVRTSKIARKVRWKRLPPRKMT